MYRAPLTLFGCTAGPSESKGSPEPLTLFGFRACTTRIHFLEKEHSGAAMHPSEARGAWCRGWESNPHGSLGQSLAPQGGQLP